MYGVIYLIRNLINGKAYIGKTIDFKRRVRDHLMGHTKQCKALNNAIKKYGVDAFTYEVLYEGIIPELLSDIERQAIREHNTKAPNGYNLTDGGDGLLNPSEETRRRMSEAHPNRLPEYNDVKALDLITI